ncbi:unnamed protein product, partial [Didymodactylos carnosus]
NTRTHTHTRHPVLVLVLVLENLRTRPSLTELYREIKIPNQSPEFEIIKDLVNATITIHGNKCGSIYGQDSTEFIVTKITRIQNANLWHKYCYKKDNIIGKNRHRIPGCDSSKYLEMKPLLTPLSDKQSNEYWLFYGCNHPTTAQLVLAGYDPRVSNLEGMFDGGFYLAENSSKSNQYIPCPRCGENAISTQIECTCLNQEQIDFKMILYRVILGDVHIAKTSDRNKYRDAINNNGQRSYVCRPPVKPNSMGDLYDSVMGESMKNDGDQLRLNCEFILYEKGQTYPKYISDFQRSIHNMRPSTNIKRVQDKCRNFLLNVF